ncbi:MAG: hypothetical protein AB1551_07330 [Actinomycetota bacterium]
MALSPRDRKALIILGAVAGLAVVAFVLLKVLGGGGGEEAASPSPTATGGPTVAPSPTVSPTPTPRETLPPAPLAGARDPFSIPPVLQTASGSASPTTSGSPTTSPTGSPTTSPTGSPTTSPTETPTTPGGGSSTTIGGHTVVLLDIYAGGTKAQVEVDGEVYTLGEGEEFGDNFKLVSISGSCARFQYGDESFTLCLSPQK